MNFQSFSYLFRELNSPYLDSPFGLNHFNVYLHKRPSPTKISTSCMYTLTVDMSPSASTTTTPSSTTVTTTSATTTKTSSSTSTLSSATTQPKSPIHHFPLNIKSKFQTKFFASLNTHLNTQPFDICLVLDNNELINAHKLILANSSNYFRRRIKTTAASTATATTDTTATPTTINNNNNNSGGVEVLKLKGLDADFECLKACVDFMYTGGAKFRVRMETNFLASLKRTASYLELSDLAKLCQLFLGHLVTPASNERQTNANANGTNDVLR